MLTNRLALRALNDQGYEFNPSNIPPGRVIVSPITMYPKYILDHMAYVARLIGDICNFSTEYLKILN